jgi:hypothetical protein
LAVDEAKTLDQPASEKTGTPGDEQVLAAYLIPECACPLKYQFQVLLW